MESQQEILSAPQNTYKVSTKINCNAYYKNRLFKLRMIMQSAVDTPDNVLQYSNL